MGLLDCSDVSDFLDGMDCWDVSDFLDEMDGMDRGVV